MLNAFECEFFGAGFFDGLQIQWVAHQQMREVPVALCKGYAACDHVSVFVYGVVGQVGQYGFPFRDQGIINFKTVAYLQECLATPAQQGQVIVAVRA